MARIHRNRVDKKWKSKAIEGIKEPYSFRLNPQLMKRLAEAVEKERKQTNTPLTLTGLIEELIREFLNTKN